MCNEDLKRLNVRGLIYDQLKEEFINWLKMGPGRINELLILLHGSISIGGLFLQYRQWPENVLLNHLNDEVQMRNHQIQDEILLLEQLEEFLQILKPLVLLFLIFGVIIVVECLAAVLDLFEELVPDFLWHVLGVCDLG